jgi:carboxypeptidase PM20D1
LSLILLDLHLIIKSAFSLSPTTDALQRTTSAVTIFQGGVKENVIPSYAEFTVNHRIHSKQSCAEVSNNLGSFLE